MVFSADPVLVSRLGLRKSYSHRFDVTVAWWLRAERVAWAVLRGR